MSYWRGISLAINPSGRIGGRAGRPKRARIDAEMEAEQAVDYDYIEAEIDRRVAERVQATLEHYISVGGGVFVVRRGPDAVEWVDEQQHPGAELFELRLTPPDEIHTGAAGPAAAENAVSTIDEESHV